MITADEARRLARLSLDKRLEELNSVVRGAAVKGCMSVRLDFKVVDALKTELESLGYTVTRSDKYPDVSELSW